MTVNLTINDISTKEAMELLQLAQKFDCTDDVAKSAVDSTAEKITETKAEPETPKSEPEKPKVEKAEPEKPKAEKTAIKIEDVRAAFADFAKRNGKDAAKDILKKFGAAKVTELKENDYADVMSALGEE